MPLTFNAGETKMFQLQAESYKAYPRHWVGREYKSCSGPGCALCAAGIAARSDYIMPISIAGVADSWAFGGSVAQQLDGFTQQGYKLLGLMIKVTRAVVAGRTTYQVSLAGAPAPVSGFTTVGQVLQQAAGAQPLTQVTVVIDPQSVTTANRWVELGYNLLAKKEFMEMVAKEVQRLKDEGLWA